jgi:hypothetical protein
VPDECFAVRNPLASNLKEYSPLGETVVMAVTLPTGGKPFCVGLVVYEPLFWDGQSPACIPSFSFEVRVSTLTAAKAAVTAPGCF